MIQHDAIFTGSVLIYLNPRATLRSPSLPLCPCVSGIEVKDASFISTSSADTSSTRICSIQPLQDSIGNLEDVLECLSLLKRSSDYFHHEEYAISFTVDCGLVLPFSSG